jgi:hypothetical protein
VLLFVLWVSSLLRVIVIGSYIIVVNAVNDKQRKIEANNKQAVNN